MLQGAAEGVSFVFSSGDSGHELVNTGLNQADYPATLPTVTAVGGTSTAIGYGGNRIFDTGWGTEKYSLSANGKNWTPLGFLYGAGGGYSDRRHQPGQPAFRGMTALALGSGHRDRVPNSSYFRLMSAAPASAATSASTRVVTTRRLDDLCYR